MMKTLTLLPAILVLTACIEMTGPATGPTTGPDTPPGQTGTLQNDMLPSAEVTAFQRADARYGYNDARIGYDSRNCAIYDGLGPDGRRSAIPLTDEAGNRICTR